ncbi:MAG TPA: hypothetical protein VKR06_34440 [Ktedonosporobacter sp.]|nr:hypothetical protein [Ktedonosporobacter sp.]
MMTKYLKIGISEILAFTLILAAVILRLILISLGWPLRNSDEGIIGIMALHIAYQGAHPIFYYGQDYMGSLQAFIAAGLFHLFGPSLFTLRLGLLLLFTLFLVSTYVLTRMLYSRSWALVTLILLGVGSSYVMTRELNAIGGYAETLTFGSLLFGLASGLVLTYQPLSSQRARFYKRQTAYVAWGLIAGLGLWSDLVILPVVVMSGLVLLLFCWREFVRGPAPLCLLTGLVIGAAPLIYFNIYTAPGSDSLTVLREIHGQGPTDVHSLLRSFLSTLHISIPMITGDPFCPVSELDFYSPGSPNTLRCTLERAWWGYGYILLLTAALGLAIGQLSHAWRNGRFVSAEKVTHQFSLRLSALRLALLGSAVLTLFFYVTSYAPLTAPGLFARYLICLLIATPAVFWPLWQGIESMLRALSTKGGSSLLVRARGGFCSVALAVVCMILLYGAGHTFTEVPSVRTTNARDQHLIESLLRAGTTHIYSDYWTCYTLDFLSKERVVCAVVNIDLRRGRNRYQPYWNIVSADPHAIYIFPRSSSEIDMSAVEKSIATSGRTFELLLVDDYVLYIPQGGM